MIFFQFVLSDLTRFVYPENIGVDTRIVILCLLELDISARLKGLAQGKIIKKSVILFWVLNMTI